jgi:hypothetical protein
MFHVLRPEGNKGLVVGVGGEWHPIAYYSRTLSRDIRKAQGQARVALALAEVCSSGCQHVPEGSKRMKGHTDVPATQVLIGILQPAVRAVLRCTRVVPLAGGSLYTEQDTGRRWTLWVG